MKQMGEYWPENVGWQMMLGEKGLKLESFGFCRILLPVFLQILLDVIAMIGQIGLIYT